MDRHKFARHFFDGNVNQHSYLALLKEIVWPYCAPFGKQIVWQQDGCPAHTANLVRD
jgi:hypothetical protein